MKLWITNHCKERYRERISNGEPVDVVKILQQISKGKDITNIVFDEAPRYILYLHEEYGEVGQTIIKADGIIFLLKKKEGTDTFAVLTCFKDENYLAQFKNTSMPRAEIYIRIKLIKAKNKQNKK